MCVCQYYDYSCLSIITYFSVTVEYPCGQLPPPETGMDQGVVGQTRLVGANHCPKGECPWQVNTAVPLLFVLRVH